MSGVLQFYYNDTAALLHDASFLFTPKTQMLRWINRARRYAAQETGCIRKHVTGQSAFGSSAQANVFKAGGAVAGNLPSAVPIASTNTLLPSPVTGAAVSPFLQTIPGLERYPYQGFFNPYLQQLHGGCRYVIDVIECSVNWGGACRPALAWLPWDDLQAYARAYATLVTSYPYYWSSYADGANGEIWLFPAPSTLGDIEIDAVVMPLDLQDEDDTEALPDDRIDAIKYGAAAYCYKAKQQYAQAADMWSDFNDCLGLSTVASNRGKTPNYYWRLF